VTGCVALLRGQDVDDGLLFALGGPAASIVIHDSPRQRNQYWRRVWGARGLLYAWRPEAAEAVIAALADEHWRVREMAVKVIAKRKIGDALHEVTALREDPVARVRAAAGRAVVVLTAAGS
jgi:HEAT repeat protein